MASAFNLTAQLNLKGPTNVAAIVSSINKQLAGINANVNIKINPSTQNTVTQLNSSFQAFNSTLSQTTTNTNAVAAALNSLRTSIGQVNNPLNNLLQNLQNNANAANQFNQNLRNTQQACNRAATTIEEMGRQAGANVRRFAAFATVTGSIYKFGNALNAAAKEFVEFNKELVRVAQVTDTNLSGLKGLVAEITALSTGFGIASNDLIKVSSTLAQAGLSARDTEKALKALALSALAPSFDSLSDTVEGSIALMRQFGISADDLEGALGSVNAVAAKFAVEASDIITAIQRTGGVFATASRGVSEGKDALNEFIAVFTSVRATTRESAETISTGLRTIFTRIQRKDTIDALKEYGVVLTDLTGKFVGPFEATKRLSEGLSKLDPRDIRFSQIVEELGGFRQIGKVIPLIQQFATAQQALKVAQQGQGSLAKDAAVAQESVANKITKVREEFIALIRSIGESNSFQTFVKLSLDLASALIRLADAAKGVLPAITAIAAIRGAGAAAQFGRGFIGGLTGNRRNRGGPITRFASGGFVPGQGNSDTVPAMLTPGEFVIRKKAVQALGVDRLASMNRYASGGLVLKQTDNDKYAGLFAKPHGNDSSGKPISIPLVSKGVEGQEILAAIGSPKSYFIGKTDETTFESDAENRLISAIEQISNNLGGPKIPSDAIKQQLVQSIGVKDIAGKIFEGVSRTIAGSFGGGSQVGFDIAKGTVNNTKAFYEMFNAGQLMPDIDYDAKLSENRDNRASLLKKAINAKLFGPDIPLISFKQKLSTEDLIRLPKGDNRNKALIQRRTELEMAKNNASQLLDDSEVEKIVLSRIQSQIRAVGSAIPSSARADIFSKKSPEGKNFGGPIQKFAKGGMAKFSLEQQRDALLLYQSGSGPFTKALASNKSVFSDRGEKYKTKDVQEKLLSTSTFNLPKSLFSGLGPSQIREIIKDTQVSEKDLAKNPKKVFPSMIGKTIDFPVFLSTSPKNSVAKNFVGDPGGMLNINASKSTTKGIDVLKAKGQKGFNPNNTLPGLDKIDKNKINAYDTEQEYILPPNTKFKINSISGSVSEYLAEDLSSSKNKSGGKKDFIDPWLLDELLSDDFVKTKLNIKAQLFNKGGSASDTVPALLTPGEFVINKKAAQRIGLSTLHRMNHADKVQGYASGGVVQKFANGGSSSMGGTMGQAAINTQAAQNATNALNNLTNASNNAATASNSAAQSFKGFGPKTSGFRGMLASIGLTGIAKKMPKGEISTGTTLALSLLGGAGVEGISNAVGGQKTEMGRNISAIGGDVMTYGTIGAQVGGAPGAVIGATLGIVTGLEKAKQASLDYSTELASQARMIAQENLGKVLSEFKKKETQENKDRLIREKNRTREAALNEEAMLRESRGGEMRGTPSVLSVEHFLDSLTIITKKVTGSDEIQRAYTQTKKERATSSGARSAQMEVGRRIAEANADTAQIVIDLVSDQMKKTGKSFEELALSMDPAEFNDFFSTLAQADAGFNAFVLQQQALIEAMINSESSAEDVAQAQKNMSDAILARTVGIVKERMSTVAAINAEKQRAEAAQKAAIILEKQVISLEKTFSIISDVFESTAFRFSQLSDRAESVLSSKIEFRDTSSERRANILQNPLAYTRFTRNEAVQESSQKLGDIGPTIANAVKLGDSIEGIVNKAKNAVVKAEQAKPEDGTDETIRIQRAIKDSITTNIKEAFGGLDNSIAQSLLESLDASLQEASKELDGSKINWNQIIEKVTSPLSKLGDESRKILLQAEKTYIDGINRLAKINKDMVQLETRRQKILNQFADTQLQNNFAQRESVGGTVTYREKARARMAGAERRVGIPVGPGSLNNLIRKLEAEQAKVAAEAKGALKSGDIKKANQLGQDLERLGHKVRDAKEEFENLPNTLQASLNDLFEEMQKRTRALETAKETASGFAQNIISSTPEDLAKTNIAYGTMIRAMNGFNVSMTNSISANKAYFKTLKDGGTAQEAVISAQQAYADENRQALQMFDEFVKFTGMEGKDVDLQRANLIEGFAKSQGLQNNPMIQTALTRLRTDPADRANQDPVLARLQAEAKVIEAQQNRAIELMTQLDNEKINILKATGKELVDEINNAKLQVEVQLKIAAQELGMELPDNPPVVPGKASGGLIYASKGKLVNFRPKGTDTVPAMLTPGEFVVNKESTSKNLGLLRSINRNKGGQINYLQNGGQPVPGRRKTYKEILNMRKEAYQKMINDRFVGYRNMMAKRRETYRANHPIGLPQEPIRRTAEEQKEFYKRISERNKAQIEADKKVAKMKRQMGAPKEMNLGGTVYASNGMLMNVQPRGTDTVPAMLTPGEFVVNRAATQRNLPLLKTINRAKGGPVQYLQDGTPSLMGNGVSNGMDQLGSRFDRFIDQLQQVLPPVIKVEGIHRVDVIVNGASVLADILNGPIGNIVKQAVQSAFDQKSRDNEGN